MSEVALRKSHVHFVLGLLFFSLINDSLGLGMPRLRMFMGATPVENSKFGFQEKIGLFNVDNIIKFKLYSRDNPSNFKELRVRNTNGDNFINITNFDPKKPTKIIVYGFTDSVLKGIEGNWMEEMKNAYLETMDVNLVILDLSLISSFLFYFTSLPRVTAMKLYNMINMLDNSGFSLNSIHIISRGYGTNVAAIAGNLLGGNLGRITGIDPPVPFIRFFPERFRLDKNDAKFVDIIHLYGVRSRYMQPTGHVDIYRSPQEYDEICQNADTLYNRLFCGRNTAVKYYTESISFPNKYPMCQCGSFDEYSEGRCDCEYDDYEFMGEHLPNNSSGVFQLISQKERIKSQNVNNAIKVTKSETLEN